jgi:uncharacterized protein
MSFEFFVRFVQRRPGLVALVGSLLGLVASFYAVRLYQNLRTDLEELLPTEARSVKDMNQLSERLEAFDNLVVLVFSAHPEGSKRYVEDLAAQLKRVPKELISRVEFRMDQELKFFRDRSALYLQATELKDILGSLRKHSNLDLKAIKENHREDLTSFQRFPGGYFATPDEKIRALVVYMPGKGLERARQMKRAIEAAVGTLDPHAYAPDLEVKYTGNLENIVEESTALVADLELSTILVSVLVLIAMFAFFRLPWATGALVLSLLMGTFWTFGVSYFLVGYLNGNTAFLASIVMGNGINFGIIFLARYLEERRQGKLAPSAIAWAMKKSAPATAVAAVAAGLSYGSLMLTSFRGFSQFGLMGLTGMVLCWISAYTLLPAYLLLAERWLTPNIVPAVKRPLMDGVASLVGKSSWALCGVSLLGVLLSTLTFRHWGTSMIESDFSKLRNRDTMEHGSGALFHYINDIFGSSSASVAVLPKLQKDVLPIAAVIREEKKKQGLDAVITKIQTLEDFVPADQQTKIRLLQRIQASANPALLNFLPAEDKTLMRSLFTPAAFQSFSEKDLPGPLLERFREKDQSVGKMIIVDKRVDRDRDDITTLSSFINTVRNSADKIAPGTPVAGELAVTYDMFQAIQQDGPKVTLCALGLVVLLVIVLFRNVRTIGLTLFALGLGVLWFAGIVLGFQLKLNFLNFIALPITFGIGVDYGVNIFQRYREEGGEKILDVIRHTGGAVVLCSLTTMIGYSSLLMAGNQAFVSFGLLAVLGEITCVTAAVIALPAFLNWRHSLKTTQRAVGNSLR